MKRKNKVKHYICKDCKRHFVLRKEDEKMCPDCGKSDLRIKVVK